MKKTLLILVLSIFIGQFTFAQNTHTGSIEIYEQYEIDGFQLAFPGISIIDGDVLVRCYDLANLHGLSSLTEITGSLIIMGFYAGADTELKDLDGLQNLQTIGYNFEIQGCDSLSSLYGLSSLSSVGSLSISGCPELQSLNGLANLSNINQHLQIGNNEKLSDISALASITEVSGTVSFGSNNLPTLNGLHNLVSCADIYLSHNNRIIDLNGLNALEQVGHLRLERNDSLVSLQGLDNLEQINGQLMIYSNESLIDLSGIDSLKTVETVRILMNPAMTNINALAGINSASLTSLEIRSNNSLSSCAAQGICDFLNSPTGFIDIWDNAPGCNTPPEIASDCGFTLTCLPYGNYYFEQQSDIDNFATDYSNCTQLAGDVLISGTDITNLNGLNGVQSINGNLEITPPQNLQMPLANLTGFENLATITGDLLIEDNGSLNSLTGLESLETIGGIFSIKDNSQLLNLDGLSSLDSIGLTLQIEDNDALQNINGLSSLKNIMGFGIVTNRNLINLGGLENLEEVRGGTFAIYDNEKLDSLTNFGNLSEIHASIRISTNPKLRNLKGFEQLHYARYVSIDNSQLTSLEGLNNLEEVDTYMQLWENSRLQDLSALGNLKYVKRLSITSNDSLSTLQELGSLADDSITNLWIKYNPMLSYCHIKAVCDVFDNPNAVYEIQENATDCYDELEVQALCEIGIDEFETASSISIYPNPASDILHISSNTGLAESRLKIYNQIGQQVISKMPCPNSVNVSKLQPGIYFLEINQADTITQHKLVIQ